MALGAGKIRALVLQTPDVLDSGVIGQVVQHLFLDQSTFHLALHLRQTE
jgi:hypothetical protein